MKKIESKNERLKLSRNGSQKTEIGLSRLKTDTNLKNLETKIRKPKTGTFEYIRISSDQKYKVYSYIIKTGGTPNAVRAQALKNGKAESKNGILVTNIKGKPYDENHRFSAGEKVYLKIPKNTETNSGNFEYIKESKDGKYKVYSYIIKSGGRPNAVRARAVSTGLADKKDGILVTKRNGKPYEENDRFSAGDKVYVKILKKNIMNTGKNNLDSRESSNKHVVSEQRMYDKIIKYGVSDKRQIAYILATAKHEAPNKSFGFKNQEEIGGRKKHYSPYYGRGFVQLTHDYNYKKFTKIIKSSGKIFKDNNGKTLDLNKIDLVRNPNIILESNDLSAFITVYGMKYGIFTGVKLDNYINDKKTDFINARRIINGKDKAYEIAKYANEYLKKLE